MSQSLDSTPRPRLGWRSLSFQARLVLGAMLITGLAVAVLSHFTFSRQAQTTQFITALLAEEDRRQAETQLLTLVANEAANADQFFNQITREINLVADNAAALLAQKSNLSSGDYWDAANELVRLSENQWGNNPTDPASVLLPASVSLNEEIISELNTLIHLDLLGPAVLNGNADLLALYFVGVDGITIYYPNINLADAAGDLMPDSAPIFRRSLLSLAGQTPIGANRIWMRRSTGWWGQIACRCMTRKGSFAGWSPPICS